MGSKHGAHCGRLSSAEREGRCAAQVIPSRGVKVAGLLGPAAALEKKGAAVAEQSVGMGGTTLWRLAGLVPSPNSSNLGWGCVRV